MTAINLADFYRTANLQPGNETIGLRIEPVKKAGDTLTATQAVDLARFYFGMPNATQATWFAELFRESDASFSLIENEREAAVLAGAILLAAFNTPKFTAILAVLSASAGGLRQPVECPQVLEQARLKLISLSLDSRKKDLPDIKSIKSPVKTKAAANGAVAAEAQDWPKLGESLKQISDEGIKNVDALVNQAHAVLDPFREAIQELREEVNILWWHVGGWSRDLEKPFAEFPEETAAILAGIDIGVMSANFYPPASSAVLLEKAIRLGRSQASTEATFESMVAGLSSSELSRLHFRETKSNIDDVCPIHTALMKANEIGTGGAWHKAFEKLTGLSPTAILTPQTFAVQALRERLLTYCL